MYGGYKTRPSRIDPIYEQVVARMYITIYLEIDVKHPHPPNNS
jgi:hypothetical protein